MNQNWFENWFDSPYYHLLYSHRNYEEAEFFINNLFEFLKVNKNSKVLDLACGKGRHSLQIHELGYNVTGIDLSAESILAAKQYEKNGLKFSTGDMRHIGYSAEFDVVVNLFTSFGYFREEGENIQVIQSISQSLKKNGILVLDYLNTHLAEKELPVENTVIRNPIKFHIKKSIQDSFIVKQINFTVEGKSFEFNEYVKRFSLTNFKTIFSSCNLEIVNTFGNYSLEDFNEEKSERLILIAQHK